MDMRLEVVVVPVSDVDRARDFYQRLGWRLDAAHGKYEQETGHPDADWPDWYARYMADEAAGQTRGEGKAGGA